MYRYSNVLYDAPIKVQIIVMMSPYNFKANALAKLSSLGIP